MNYRVEFTERAKADLFEIYRWIAADSPVDAVRWIATLESAIRGLDTSPERCAVAPENDDRGEFEIRHLVVGPYRVLFAVRDRAVFVLHIRHGSRRTASSEEIAEALRKARDPDPR